MGKGRNSSRVQRRIAERRVKIPVVPNAEDVVQGFELDPYLYEGWGNVPTQNNAEKAIAEHIQNKHVPNSTAELEQETKRIVQEVIEQDAKETAEQTAKKTTQEVAAQTTKKATQETAEQLSRHSLGKMAAGVVTLAGLGLMIRNMNERKGRQSNQELYGQRRSYM